MRRVRVRVRVMVGARERERVRCACTCYRHTLYALSTRSYYILHALVLLSYLKPDDVRVFEVLEQLDLSHGVQGEAVFLLRGRGRAGDRRHKRETRGERCERWAAGGLEEY